MANRIERPISISAVRDCLGVSTNSLKTLCRSEAIAEWAKYKPTIIADNPSIRPANWWQADQNSGNDCGFSLPIFSLNTGALNNTNLKNKFTADGKNGWNYNRVSGSYKNRLLDFEGYFNQAAPPFSLGSDVINAYEGDESVTIMPMISAYSGDDVLRLRDFAFTTDRPFYLGAFLTNADGSQYKRVISYYDVTADNSGEVGSGGSKLVSLPISDLPAGTYTIYTIIASESVGYNEGNGDAEPDTQVTVLPAPCVPPITLNILEVKEPYMLTASYKRYQIGGSIEPSFTFTNQTIYSVQIKDIKAKYLLGGSWDNVAVETGWGSNIFTVPMDSSYTPTLSPALIPTQTSGADRVGIELTVVVLDANGNPTGETIIMRAVSGIIFTPSGGLTVVSE